MKEGIFTIVSLLISFLSITITYISFKQKNSKNKLDEGKSEGLLVSDIKYIKECVERLERTLNRVEEKYYQLEIRITKIEEKLRKEEKR